jgi:arylsulfatase A-like enzyme
MLAACLLGTADIAGAQTRQVRPNVVLVVIDDLGYGDLACYGNPQVRTPHIDRLAREGVRFAQAYAPSPVCSPSRAGLLTGRWPVRSGVTDAIGDAGDRWNRGRRLVPPPNAKSLALEEVTLAEVFRGAGYATANIGKWHLGGEGFLPQDQGFDVNFAGNSLGSQKSMFGPDYGIGLPPAPAGEHLAERVQREAEDFMRRRRDQPFFVHLSHYSVHRPVGARPETVARYPQKGPAPWGLVPEYAAMIEEMDSTIGRLMKFLEEEGLAANTIVVFVSDNGAVRWWGSNGPLRGTKGTVFEAGIRVPLIIRAPGVTGAGRVSDVPVHGCDLFPTLLELAGIPLPAGRPSDGLSLLPILRGAGGLPADRPMLWHFPHYNMHGATPATALRQGRYKLIRFYETGREELYDLEADPAENTNLSAARPELLRQLGARLAGLLAATGAQMPRVNAEFAFVEPELKELQPFESTRTNPPR